MVTLLVLGGLAAGLAGCGGSRRHSGYGPTRASPGFFTSAPGPAEQGSPSLSAALRASALKACGRRDEMLSADAGSWAVVLLRGRDQTASLCSRSAAAGLFGQDTLRGGPALAGLPVGRDQVQFLVESRGSIRSGATFVDGRVGSAVTAVRLDLRVVQPGAEVFSDSAETAQLNDGWYLAALANASAGEVTGLTVVTGHRQLTVPLPDGLAEVPANAGAELDLGVAGAESVSERAGTGATVVIPKVAGSRPAAAYARLHRLGLAVTLTGYTSPSLYGCSLSVQGISPAPGVRVARGSVVSVSANCDQGLIASIAVPDHMPRYRVPNFVGRRPSAVSRWIDPRGLDLSETFAPLYAADAPNLLANYRVVRQRPAPGATLQLGVSDHGGFLPTPLIIWLGQVRTRR